MQKYVFICIASLLLHIQCYQMPVHQGNMQLRNKQRIRSRYRAYPQNPPAKNSRATERMKLLIEIRSYLNTPYVSGGTTHRGVDCSGLVVAVYKTSLGIELPHNSTMLYKKGSRITRNALKFGDLIFFKNRRRSRISHVGIYLKDTKFVHASSSKGVIVSDLVQDEYYKKRYAGACRIKRFN